ncbi:MAG: hypothetical protein LBG98_00440 [Puniceicoccales bacterium]|nr:hypothetical protein [Puniceicoccales bacterium]
MRLFLLSSRKEEYATSRDTEDSEMLSVLNSGRIDHFMDYEEMNEMHPLQR